MATEDRTAEDAAEASNGNGSEGKAGIVSAGVDALKARVAAKRGAAGKQAMIQGGDAASDTATAPAAPSSDTSATTHIPADAGLAEDEITPAAKDELARLASIREAPEFPADVSPPDSEPETSDGSGDPEQSVMEGLAAEGAAEGGSLYEKRQAEIAAAKARPDGKTKAGKSTGTGKAKTGTGAAASLKEKIKAQKEKEKARAKEKTEKQKEKEAERKAKDKEKKEARAKAEKERKEKLAAQKKERAAERAAKKVPDLMSKENKAMQAAFAEDYAIAGPKSDRNPNGIGIRRAKADRGDFAAGYIMAVRRIRRAQSEGASAA